MSLAPKTIRLTRNADGSYRYDDVEIVPLHTESGASIEGWLACSPRSEIAFRTLRDIRDYIARHGNV